MKYKVGDKIEVMQIIELEDLNDDEREAYEYVIGEITTITEVDCNTGGFYIHTTINDKDYIFGNDEVELVLEHNRNGANT